MAQDFDDINRQIQALAQKVEALGGIKIADVNAYTKSFGDGIDGAIKALASLRKEMQYLDTDIDYVFTALRSIASELNPAIKGSKDIIRSFTKLGSLSREIKLDQDEISKLTQKSATNLLKKVEATRSELTNQIKINEQEKINIGLRMNMAQFEDRELPNYQNFQSWQTLQEQFDLAEATNREANAFIGEIEDADSIYNTLLKTIHKRLDAEEGINKNLGITGQLTNGLVTTLGKLGIKSEAFSDMNENMKLAASQIGRDGKVIENKFGVMKEAAKGIGHGISEGLKDPLLRFAILAKVAKFFFDAALTANRQLVEMGKSLGNSSEEYRKTLVQIQGTTDNINVNTATLTEAQLQLTRATGFASQLTQDQLETQIKLTKQYRLTEEEAANINRFAILSNKTSQQTLDSFNKALVTTRNQVRVGVDMKAALIEASKVSGQLAANLGYNPSRIAEAVIKTKALGLALEEVRGISKSFLDFESSISSELEAQLITGENINLDRARVLALTGDYAGLAQEITNQGITQAKFSKMNILQQDSIAQAFGMSADALGEMLTKQALALSSGKSFAALTEEENKKAMERQTIEDKFAVAMLKLKTIVGDLVAGPFGQLLDMAVSLVGKLSEVANWLNENKILMPLLSAGIGFVATGFNPFGALAGLGVGMAGQIAMEDGAIAPGPGKFLTTPEGSFRFSENDTIVAGTKLFQPQQQSSTPQPMMNINELLSKIDKLIQITDKKMQLPQMAVSMDGVKVGEMIKQYNSNIS